MSYLPRHDYDLLRRILVEMPELEQNTPALAREYTARHPDGVKMPVSTVRTILRSHGVEILGRPYQPATRRPVEHDYDLLREIVQADPSLLCSPVTVAREYEAKTGKAIHPNYVGSVLREWRVTISRNTPQGDDSIATDRGLPPARSAAIDRFGEVLRIYREMDPRAHDALHGDDWSAYYADLLTDGIHWALIHGISVEKAVVRAWDTVTLERAK